MAQVEGEGWAGLGMADSGFEVFEPFKRKNMFAYNRLGSNGLENTLCGFWWCGSGCSERRRH
jgi:hypothetical protein